MTIREASEEESERLKMNCSSLFTPVMVDQLHHFVVGIC